jgi:hypothetical protein
LSFLKSSLASEYETKQIEGLKMCSFGFKTGAAWLTA